MVSEYNRFPSQGRCHNKGIGPLFPTFWLLCWLVPFILNFFFHTFLFYFIHFPHSLASNCFLFSLQGSALPLFLTLSSLLRGRKRDPQRSSAQLWWLLQIIAMWTAPSALPHDTTDHRPFLQRGPYCEWITFRLIGEPAHTYTKVELSDSHSAACTVRSLHQDNFCLGSLPHRSKCAT